MKMKTKQLLCSFFWGRGKSYPLLCMHTWAEIDSGQSDRSKKQQHPSDKTRLVTFCTHTRINEFWLLLLFFSLGLLQLSFFSFHSAIKKENPILSKSKRERERKIFPKSSELFPSRQVPTCIVQLQERERKRKISFFFLYFFNFFPEVIAMDGRREKKNETDCMNDKVHTCTGGLWGGRWDGRT